MVSKLHSILKPFLLRRVKTDVESALPGKLELVLYAPMAPQQRKINDQLLKKTLEVKTVNRRCSCAWFVLGYKYLLEVGATISC